MNVMWLAFKMALDVVPARGQNQSNSNYLSKKNMDKKNFRAIWLFATAFAMLIITGCNNDEDFFQWEDLDINNFNPTTRSACLSYSDYLTISSFERRLWTEKDYESISKAIERMEIIFSESENMYIFNAFNVNEINISDSLYKCVKQMLEHTNGIIKKTAKTKISRLKARSNEGSASGLLPDCVPAAVANMGTNAPSYDEAIAKCDEMFPGWRTSGGVPIDEIQSFIEVYTPVTEYSDLSTFSMGETTLDNDVMVFATHAVNAYRIFKSAISPVIYYEDHSSSGSGGGFILGEEMRRIYISN